MREGLDRGADHTRDKDLCLSAGFANRKGKSLETELGNELRTRDMGKLTTRGCAKRMISGSRQVGFYAAPTFSEIKIAFS